MEKAKPVKNFFTRALVKWHSENNTRDLPWKGETDPYKIWLSEIILQQTRALQGMPYYEKFVSVFPSVADLATANDDDVFRIWQGLGYYNRCKNMLATARFITEELNGRFPDTYEGLLELKGIGPYTAAAIGSFAFGLPQAVVDGNVYRVLARYFGIDVPFDTTEGKKLFAMLAQELLDKKDSAGYNQAIMDLGATVCTPSNPVCAECPLVGKCMAYHGGLIGLLPVRSKKIVVRSRYFNYFMLIAGKEAWVHKRPAGDIWENLYQPYLIETDASADLNALLGSIQLVEPSIEIDDITSAGSSKQRLTHQLINTSFYIIKLKHKPLRQLENGIWLCINELKNLAFPKTLFSFLRNNLYF
jgi:A/G-specific adenine glycosylase